MVHEELEKHQDKWKYIKSFLSGGIAAIVSKSIIAPIERVKYTYIVIHILFQTRSKAFTYKLFFTDFMYII